MGKYDKYVDTLVRLSHNKLNAKEMERKLQNLCVEYKLDPEDATKFIARQEGLAVAVFEPYTQDWKEFHFCQGCGNWGSPNCFDCLWIPSDFKPIDPQYREMQRKAIFEVFGKKDGHVFKTWIQKYDQIIDAIENPRKYLGVSTTKSEGIAGSDYAQPCPKCNSEHTGLMPDNLSYCNDCGHHYDTKVDHPEKVWKIFHYSNFCPYYDYEEGSNDGCLYNGQERPMMCDPDLCPIKVEK